MSQDYRRVQMFCFLSIYADRWCFVACKSRYVLWRARVGIFNAFEFQTQVKSNMKNPLLFLKIFLLFINYIYATLIYLISFSKFRFLTNILQLLDVEILFLLYIKILLYFCGDIEINPGPKRSSLTFCPRNLNGVAAHEFIKVLLLLGYITECNFDIICLPETFLNSSLDSEDDRLKPEVYNLIRSDHPSGSKRGGVCVYYKEHIPLVRRDDLCTFSNCLVTEIHLQNEECFLTCLYQSPSQTQHEFENFCANLDTLTDHINNILLICCHYWRP